MDAFRGTASAFEGETILLSLQTRLFPAGVATRLSPELDSLMLKIQFEYHYYLRLNITFQTSLGERSTATKEECIPILHLCGKSMSPKTPQSGFLEEADGTKNALQFFVAPRKASVRSEGLTVMKAASLNSSDKQYTVYA